MGDGLDRKLLKVIVNSYDKTIPVHTVLEAIETVLCSLFIQEDSMHIMRELSGMASNVVQRVQAERSNTGPAHD